VNKDQIIWAVSTGAVTVFAIVMIVALFRGWAPRRREASFDPRWVGASLAVALVGVWIGTIPLMVTSSEQTQLRWMNVGFCFGVAGLVIQFVPGIRAMFGGTGRAGRTGDGA